MVKPKLTALIVLFILIQMALFGCKGVIGRKEAEFISRRAETSISLLPQAARPVDVFLLLDQSGSMSGYRNVPPTDPNGLRVEASRYFVRNIALKSDPKVPNRVGIVNFGTQAPPDLTVPLMEVVYPKIDPRNVESLLSSLRPLSLGETNFVAALRAAEEGFRSKGTFQQARKPVVVIFTDGEPYDPRRLPKEAYFQEIEQLVSTRLRPNNVELFLIWIDALGQSWERYAPRWQRILSPQNVYRITAMEELRDKFNEIVQVVFDIPKVPPEVVTPAGLDFELPPYLEKVEFHVFPEAERLTLKIFRPDGTAIGRDDPGVSVRGFGTYDEIVIADPAPGKWRYQIVEGRGKVKVYRNPILIKMKLVRPEGVHPLGKPMTIVASFLRVDGREVVPHPQYPLKLFAKVVGPDGAEKDLLLHQGGRGLYFSDPLPIPQPGIYKILLKVQAADVQKGVVLTSTAENQVEVWSMPYVMVESPSAGSTLPFSNALSIEAKLLQEGNPISPEAVFSTPPGASIIAQVIETPSGKKSDPIWLDSVPEQEAPDRKPGRFHGVLPASLQEEGGYLLGVKVVGELRSGEKIPGDSSEVVFVVRPSGWQIFWKYTKYGLVVLGIAVGATVVGVAGWTVTSPPMQGTLAVYPSEEEVGQAPVARQRLDRRRVVLFWLRKSPPTSAGLFIVSRRRRQRDRVVIRLWQGILPRSRMIPQGSSARLGRFFIVYQ